MAAEAAFAGAGAEAGTQVWRIEAMVPVPVAREVYGSFHQGDSYIVLSTTLSRSGSKSYNIHFWLGSETSQDEAGVAAYKTVELDGLLGGTAVQFRETEGHESVEYLAGGVESGFTHVERDVYRKRLLQLKGRRNVRMMEVEPKASSMNHGDVFILDLGLKLYLWAGEEANRYEKAQGLLIITRLRDSRGARPTAIVMADNPDDPAFWGELEGDQSDVKSAADGGDDRAAETRAAEDVKLFRVSDASGTLEVTPVERVEGKLRKDMLDGDDVFILDAGSAVFVWIGKGATADEKRNGMKLGADFLTSQGRPDWTPVTRVVQGGETPELKSFFFQFDPVRKLDFTQRSSGIAGTGTRVIEKKDVDIAALHHGRDLEDKMVDDGSGTLEIWRIEHFERVPLAPELYGQFFSGDSYIVKYTWHDHGMESVMLYFWQGRESSTDEKGASALLVTDMDRELGGCATQVRVVQGKEPSHFCALFKGRMVVHLGGVAGAFDSAEAGMAAEAASAATGTKLYHVKGTTPLNTKAVQVPPEARNLNCGDCFVLLTDEKCWVWQGKGATADERAVAGNTVEILKGAREVVVMDEEAEDDAFWEALGGKTEYATEAPPVDLLVAPRLFQISDVVGYVKAEEIFNFTQEDLIDDDVMLLDAVTQVFVWVGSKSTEQEKRSAMDIAKKYVQTLEDGRDPDAPIVRIDAGREPAIFTCHFQGWDREKARVFEDPYEARLRHLRETEAARRAAAEAEAAAADAERASRVEAATSPRASPRSGGGEGGAAADSDEKSPRPAWKTTVTAKTPTPVSTPPPAAAPVSTESPAVEGVYPYESLRGPGDRGLAIDCKKKEAYMSDAEFHDVFGMTKAAFYKQPKWRQSQQKKDKDLF